MAPKRKRNSGSSSTKKKKDKESSSTTNDNTSVASSSGNGQETPTLPPVLSNSSDIVGESSSTNHNGESAKSSSEVVNGSVPEVKKEEEQQLPNGQLEEESSTKKRKLTPTENTIPEIPRRKFEMVLKKSESRKSDKPFRFTPLSTPTISTKTHVTECAKPTCYLCQIQKQRSGSPEPLPSVDPVEISIENYLDNFCEQHKAALSVTDNKTPNLKSISDMILSTLISAKDSEEEELHGDEIFKFEKKVDMFSGIAPSLIIRLFSSYFTIEVPKTNDVTSIPSTLSTRQTMIKYNEATKAFLTAIAKCKLTPDLVEELRELNCTFYDGSAVVQVTDMRVTDPTNKKTPHPTQVILLKPEPTNLEKQICEFIEENLGESDQLSSSQRLEVMQKILNAVKSEPSDILNNKSSSLCLNPDPKVGILANAIHYNNTKQFFRRRTRPKHHYFNYSQKNQAATENVTQPSVIGQKQEHHLLNFIVNTKTWSESLLSRKEKATILHLPNNANKKKKQKLSSKQRKSKENEIFPRNQQSESVPAEYVRLNEASLVNNKPPNRCRILKFESYDKQKTWRVDIIPHLEMGVEHSKKFEAFILPPHTTNPNSQQQIYPAEQPSCCVIGGRHAAELYARRLKDMFTSNGKTKLMMDHELDLQSYISDSRLPKPPLLLQRLNKYHPSMQSMKPQPNQPAQGNVQATPGTVPPGTNFINQPQPNTAGVATMVQGAGAQPPPSTSNATVAANGGTMFAKPMITTVGGTVIPAGGVTRTVTGTIPPTATTAQLGANAVVQNIHPNMFAVSGNILLNTMLSRSGYPATNFSYLLTPTGGIGGGTATINPNFLMRPGTTLPTGVTINPATGQPTVTNQPAQPQNNNTNK
ncbi:hypothetical protein C9374_004980 [Naegleria lovaniensis]|uniref:Spt20-like SEP domain-containing protein n=1 Tax=Naegleria lovaniensis TaxID=51637 RepID=A0AA88KKH6_NAELO|nr:uncharacterized protein C9374_004980 [Naegleria lovaniensis]KAG2383013.1 hypothetical protein C9374_004980 [Naegleria lovaniensis]